MQTFKYFLSFYKPYKGMFFLDLLCASVISLVDVAYPIVLNLFVSDVLSQSASIILAWLPWIALALIAVYILKSACRFYVTCQGHIMGAMMERDMRRDLFEQYTRLSFDYYDRQNTGQLSSRMLADLMDISELAHHGPENLFISLIKIIGAFAVMFMLNVPLSMVLLAVTLVMLAFSFYENRRMEATFLENRRRVADINSAVIDSLEGIRVVQAFGNEETERRKFKTANERFLDAKKDNYTVAGVYYTGNHFFQGLLYTIILVLGGYLCAKGNMSPADLATFALYVNVFVAPLEILIEFTEMFQKGFTGFRRFQEIVEEQPTITDSPDAKPLVDPQGTIAFENVSFGYDDGEEVLEDVSFTIPAGKSYALAGPSGSGKTTICSLIPRFYDVQKGSVSIDGQDVRSLTLESLRDAVGLVSQDVYLFNGTIADNIRVGKADASDEEVLAAASRAHLDDFLASLPEGIHTQVGEKGTRLSGGQKQRISIARVFLKNPKILILDEATSALDNESEYYIQQALQELAENRTCLTIAHRLSTIENADQILVVAEQGILEQGTHEELLEKNGLYASYVKHQFS